MGIVGPFFGCMVMDETWFWVGGGGEGWMVSGKTLFGGLECVVHFFGCMGLAGAWDWVWVGYFFGWVGVGGNKWESI